MMQLTVFKAVEDKRVFWFTMDEIRASPPMTSNMCDIIGTGRIQASLVSSELSESGLYEIHLHQDGHPFWPSLALLLHMRNHLMQDFGSQLGHLLRRGWNPWGSRGLIYGRRAMPSHLCVGSRVSKLLTCQGPLNQNHALWGCR